MPTLAAPLLIESITCPAKLELAEKAVQTAGTVLAEARTICSTMLNMVSLAGALPPGALW